MQKFTLSSKGRRNFILEMHKRECKLNFRIIPNVAISSARNSVSEHSLFAQKISDTAMKPYGQVKTFLLFLG